MKLIMSNIIKQEGIIMETSVNAVDKLEFFDGEPYRYAYSK